MRIRADDLLVKKQMVQSRSQASNLIKLGKVWIAALQVHKPGQMVNDNNSAEIRDKHIYVSRAGYKLESVAEKLGLDFRDKVVLDVGSSTGGFTDYSLKHGANKVIAVDVGTDQLHPSLHGNEQIELHEKTDIRNFKSSAKIDIIVIDVSFISLRDILPSVARLSAQTTQIVAMVKPQFEAGSDAKHKGVIKNDKMRRDILKDLEFWIQKMFTIIDKADSEVAGAKGNRERFYHLKLLN